MKTPRRKPAPPRPRAASRAAARPRATPAELSLLALARDVTALGRGQAGATGAGADPPANADGLAAALERLAAAYDPHERLPREVYRAWLASRSDKTRALALAWAREQLRLGLQEVIEQRSAQTRRALGLSAEMLAWLLLAACESLAQEPPGAVLDRLRALLDLNGHPGHS